MVSRIQITAPVYMQLDGQGQIVLPGSVIDVPNAAAFNMNHYTPAAGTPGVIPSHGQPVSVSGIRTR